MPEEENTIGENKEDLNEGKSEENEVETKKEISPEEKIVELEDKLTRSFAELENQRRRFEKEKDEAFDYGGMVFARDALNLLDNLERSKQILQEDLSLKDLWKISFQKQEINNDIYMGLLYLGLILMGIIVILLFGFYINSNLEISEYIDKISIMYLCLFIVGPLLLVGIIALLILISTSTNIAEFANKIIDTSKYGIYKMSRKK